VAFINTVEFSRYDTLMWFTLKNCLWIIILYCSLRIFRISFPFLYVSTCYQNNTGPAYFSKHVSLPPCSLFIWEDYDSLYALVNLMSRVYLYWMCPELEPSDWPTLRPNVFRSITNWTFLIDV
jgi:hypothetical protein